MRRGENINKHANAHTRRYAHTCTHTHTHPLTHTHSLSHSLTHSLSLSHTHTWQTVSRLGGLPSEHWQHRHVSSRHIVSLRYEIWKKEMGKYEWINRKIELKEVRKPDIWTTVTNDCEGEDKEEAVRGLRNEIGLRKDDRKWEERNCSKSRRQIKGFKCNLVDHWYNQLYCYCTVLVVRSPSSFLLSTSLKSASLLSCIYCQAESSQDNLLQKKRTEISE